MAQDGDEIQCGRITIAPPDRHLLLTRERVRVVYGPRENHFRPAVDPLFRSAALAFRAARHRRCADGRARRRRAGLVAIKRQAGWLWSRPNDRRSEHAARAAMAYVEVDACLPVVELASKIAALTETEASILKRHMTPLIWSGR